MAITAVVSLVDALRQLRLLDARQLKELPVLQARFSDPRELAKDLVRRGWLTLFQAKQILQGRGNELVLGSYVLLDKLGEGGMGQVLKARNWKLGTVVALKLIRKDRMANPRAVRRFQREVRATAQLNHTNIVTAHDADEVQGNYLLVMEYVEGMDLARLVKEKGPLPVAQACDFMRQAALGLQHAYERSLVHRDIKPSNLLVASKGSVIKILDLGLARVDDPESDDTETATLTHDGMVIGTPDYIAPEQARSAHTADIRSDLYSLGCTFYFILTGRVPFAGGTHVEKLVQHQLEQARPIEELRPDVPPKVAAVVRKLMAKKPEERFQTPAELAAALATPDRSRPSPTISPRRFPRWLLPVAAVALVTMLVLGGAAAGVLWLATGRKDTHTGATSGNETHTALTSSQEPPTPKDIKRGLPLGFRFAPHRDHLLQTGGGNEQSERAVQQGLAWLARQQKPDGSWTCQGYDPGIGDEGFPVAATALALLPFLGAGQAPGRGDHAKTVAAGLRWLVEKQEADGRFRNVVTFKGGATKAMYEQALATTALCEAYGLTGDAMLRKVAQKGVTYLVQAQHPAGGWWYEPGRPGDTSVTGWAVEALTTGQLVGLEVPKATWERLGNFLDSVASPMGYRYMPEIRANPSPTCTAIGILARARLGRKTQDPQTRKEIEVLLRMPPTAGRSDIYYYYHATQAVYHIGIAWPWWNGKMRDLVIERQTKDGSWTPIAEAGHAKVGGRLMVTSFALLTLETYYRHTPLHLAEQR